MGHNDKSKDTNKNSKKLNGKGNIKINQANQNVSKKTALPKKVYTARNSPLTDLMAINHFQTIYNIWTATFVLIFINITVYYIAAPELYWRDTAIFSFAVSNKLLIMKSFICLNVFAFIIFYGFKTWIWIRYKINTKLTDLLFLFIYMASLAFLFVAPAYILLTQSTFPVLSNVFIIVEQIRIIMKTYSFVRECVPRVLQYKPSTDGKQEHNLCPTARHYLYYLFVPAAIYRDSYPRRKEINYGFIAEQIFKIFACMFIAYCAWALFVVGMFKDLGTRPFTVKEASLAFAGSTIIGSMSMFLLSYGFIHSWMNLRAELLRFADREFYQDFWNSSTYSEFFRKWNGVVHDWLYTYVYIDLSKIGFSRSLSVMIVFAFSGAMHEYLLAISLGFFCPVLGAMYLLIGASIPLVQKHGESQSGNTIIWTTMFIGCGCLFFMGFSEWFARRNCQSLENPIQDFFKPRIWSNSCHFITFS